tara:strand:- start:373 stop:546 length:174 start_codon:yes stop_codon:yes gene_type:complete
MTLIITVIVVALAVLGGFSVVATVTPNEADNKKLQGILTAINTLGMNVLKAKNKLVK